MRVLVVGATGAIGRSLIKSLRLAGHTIFGMVRSQRSSGPVSDSGAEPVIADALDASTVSAALVKVRPDVIINELTSLPKHYTSTEMKAAAERDARVRLEGNKNLIAAAQQTGVRRFLLQSTGFSYAPGRDLADEGERFACGASAAVADGAQCYAQLEAMTFGRTEFEAVALRYGFFYGPGTWFTPRPLQWLVYTNGTKLLPGNRARLGETHFETWLTQFAGSARAASTRTDKR